MGTATKAKLPVPSFFKAKNAEDWNYNPNMGTVFGEAEGWAKKHGIKPSGTDQKKVHLLLIDVQKDFCYPSGTLYVGGRSGDGAVEDSKRIAKFIYENMGSISDVTATFDTHLSHQIFFPSFWVDKQGAPLAPFRFIKHEEIRAGDVVPNPAVAPFVCGGNYGWLMDYVKFYTKSLESVGKYSLYVWPWHCLLGTTGHSLVGVIDEARMFHSWVRKNLAASEVKGGGLLTENYSVLSPEVTAAHDGRPVGQRNTRFIKTLLESDYVVIAGQAASHCVKSSIDDLLGAINAQDPKLAKKVYILKDCMSSVVVPNVIDFTQQAEDALKKFADAGMHVVDSTTPIEDWAGVTL